MLHDSLQTEFMRLANSTPKTFKDVLLIKERTSPYRQDAELAQAVATAEPFFDSLDSIPLYRKTEKNIVSVYKTFLAQTLKSGINSKDELLDFIREEDRLFRSFLAHLPELADADLSAITGGTEQCCLSVFQSAEDGKFSYRDALIYFAKRTDEELSSMRWLAGMTSTKTRSRRMHRHVRMCGCCCNPTLHWTISVWLCCPIWKGCHCMV